MGQWVSEIRQPEPKREIWLGSYETPRWPPHATTWPHCTSGTQWGPSQLPPSSRTLLPRPASSKPEDVQLAAQEAALSFRKPIAENCSLGPVRIGLSPSQIQAINESPLDSPKMWMELAAGTFWSPEQMLLYDGIDEV
ncbi:hypothetical protein CUMW_195170 [Citrus unshiu]|uniref:Uncharacterized protein n=1 Tax=Citrus unshiu TaxID=55188 RepID=A0A2H5Q4F5_CITUN|nr:hypothetical protein CUMW_195170 [Citrus unshiu]